MNDTMLSPADWEKEKERRALLTQEDLNTWVEKSAAVRIVLNQLDNVIDVNDWGLELSALDRIRGVCRDYREDVIRELCIAYKRGDLEKGVIGMV